jgi:hypothetical protein
MLEAHCLLVRPCGPFESSPGAGTREVRLCQIDDPATRKPLGFVYRRTPTSLWQRWLSFLVVAVHEANDEPLLFTMQPRWPFSATWEVRDADEHAIGVLHPLALAGSTRAASEIRAPGRQIIARFQAGERANDAGAFLNSDGLLLGRVEPTADGVNLQFSESVAEHPITKMLLLAAVVHYVVSSSQK